MQPARILMGRSMSQMNWRCASQVRLLKGTLSKAPASMSARRRNEGFSSYPNQPYFTCAVLRRLQGEE